jgi:hypothetical protein
MSKNPYNIQFKTAICGNMSNRPIADRVSEYVSVESLIVRKGNTKKETSSPF